MYSATTKLKNKSGISGRPASRLVSKAKEFSCDIRIGDANAKNLAALLRLQLEEGALIHICAEGEDEGEAVTAIVDLINRNLGEI